MFIRSTFVCTYSLRKFRYRRGNHFCRFRGFPDGEAAGKWKFICILAGMGLFLFLKNGMLDYLLFRVPFAFLDYEKAGSLVMLENILMLLFWAFIGTQAALLCRNLQRKEEDRKDIVILISYKVIKRNKSYTSYTSSS